MLFELNNKKIVPFGFLCISLFLFSVFSLSLTELPFGIWEANSLFFTFTPQLELLNLSINPRGSVGSYEYLALDVVRLFLPSDRFALLDFRIISIFYSAVAVGFCFFWARTLFDSRFAIIGLLLLLSSGAFVAFSFQFLIISFSLMVFCGIGLFYELAVKTRSKIFIIAFFFFCYLGLSHYYLTRIVAVLYIIAFGVNIYVNSSIRKSLQYIFLFLVGCFFVAPVNIGRILLGRIFVPEDGGEGANEFSMSSSSLLDSLGVNVALMLDSFFGRSSFYASNIFDSLVAAPILIGSPLNLLLVLIGSVVLFRRKKYPVLVIGMLVAGAPVLSKVWVGELTSLSPYRQIFSVIPIAIFGTAALTWMVKESSSRFWVAFYGCLILVGFSWIGVLEDKHEYLERVDWGYSSVGSNCAASSRFWSGSGCLGSDFFGENEPVVARPSELGAIYFNDFVARYYRMGNTIKSLVTCGSRSDDPVIVKVEPSDLRGAQSHLSGFRHELFLLALVLEKNECSVQFPIVYSRQLTAVDKFVGWSLGLLYTGQVERRPWSRQNLYPLRLDETGHYKSGYPDFYDKLYALDVFDKVGVDIPRILEKRNSKDYSTFVVFKGALNLTPDIVLVSNAFEEAMARMKFPDANLMEVRHEP